MYTNEILTVLYANGNVLTRDEHSVVFDPEITTQIKRLHWDDGEKQYEVEFTDHSGTFKFFLDPNLTREMNPLIIPAWEYQQQVREEQKLQKVLHQGPYHL